MKRSLNVLWILCLRPTFQMNSLKSAVYKITILFMNNIEDFHFRFFLHVIISHSPGDNFMFHSIPIENALDVQPRLHWKTVALNLTQYTIVVVLLACSLKTPHSDSDLLFNVITPSPYSSISPSIWEQCMAVTCNGLFIKCFFGFVRIIS